MVASDCPRCNSKLLWRLGTPLVLLWMTVVMNVQAYAADPSKSTSQILSGKFVEIEKKGRLMLLKLTDKEDKEQQVLVNERTNFHLRAPGKPEMLQQGQMITLEGTQTDLGDLITDKLTLHWGGSAPIRILKNPKEPQKFEATGRLESLQGNVLMMYFGVEGGSRPVQVRENPTIEVVTTDPAALKPKLPLEIEIHQVKGQKLPTALSISATVDESFWNSPEGLAVAKKKKTGTVSKDTAPKDSTTKTTTKSPFPKTSKTSKPTNAVPESKDPFGVQKK